MEWKHVWNMLFSTIIEVLLCTVTFSLCLRTTNCKSNYGIILHIRKAIVFAKFALLVRFWKYKTGFYVLAYIHHIIIFLMRSSAKMAVSPAWKYLNFYAYLCIYTIHAPLRFLLALFLTTHKKSCLLIQTFYLKNTLMYRNLDCFQMIFTDNGRNVKWLLIFHNVSIWCTLPL